MWNSIFYDGIVYHMGLNSSNRQEHNLKVGTNVEVKTSPSPKAFKAAFEALSAPESFDSAVKFLKGQGIERLPAAIIRLMVKENHAERVAGLLDLVRSNTIAAQQVTAALAYLLRHENREVAGRAARSFAALETARIAGFIPVISLEMRREKSVVVEQFRREPIGCDAVVFQDFSACVRDLMASDRVNQSRMLSEAATSGWYSSDHRAVVTLGALCSDCPELRRGALSVLKRQVGVELDPITHAMLESALAFATPDVLSADVEPQIRNTFLFVCTQLKPSPALASVILEAHSLIQSQAARTNRPEKHDLYATVMLCSAATELLPAEHREEPLSHLMRLLDGSGQYSFYGAFSLVQLGSLLGREQGERILGGVVDFLGRHIRNEKPRGAISTLVSALGAVRGFDRFLFERCRQLVITHHDSALACQRLHRILTVIAEQSEDTQLMKEAQPLLSYLSGSLVAESE